jgi:hypothetical protein
MTTPPNSADNIDLHIPMSLEALTAEFMALREDFIALAEENKQLKARIAWFEKQLFGSKSEKRGVLIEGIPLDYAACCTPLKAYSFNTHLSFLSPELIQDAQSRGLKNWVYTVNSADDWSYVQALGVDAVFTDKPDALLAFNQRHK